MVTGVKDVEFLACSRARTDILEQLSQGDGLTERELREQVDYSRTTVHRNLNALLERGWIQNTGQEYSASTCGEIILEQFSDLTDTVESANHLQPFLKEIPRSEFDVDISGLQDAEITVAEPGNPLAMVNRHVQKIKKTEDLQALLPITSLHPYEIQHRRILQDELQAEHVVSPTVAETFQSDPDYASLTQEMVETGLLELYVYDGDIPYYLGLLDDTVQIGTDKGGTPEALLESQSDQLRDWAEDKYREYKAKARKISGHLS